ncbi:MAG TPA: hypothetical protein VF787_08165 [Thermoanaerobaculia bacterium]
MRTDRKAGHLVLDYVAMTEQFGELDYDEFVEVWEAADALMETALAAGFDPADRAGSPHEAPA